MAMTINGLVSVRSRFIDPYSEAGDAKAVDGEGSPLGAGVSVISGSKRGGQDGPILRPKGGLRAR